MARPPLAVEQQRQPGVMMIRGLLTAGAVAAGVFAGAAQATVIYDWQTLNVGNVPAFTSRIEIDDAAWLSGSVNYTWSIVNDCTGFNVPDRSACRADPGAPITRFAFSLTVPNAAVDLQPRIGQTLFGPIVTPLRLGLTFLPNGQLSGRVEGHNDATDIAMSGNGIWNVTQYSSDFPNTGGCFVSPDRACTATGQWLLDIRTIPGRVPEPGILPLLALGAFGMAASMRRRRT